METFLDPIPDRNLLDYNFEGYKLTVYESNIITTQLTTTALRRFPNPKKYSLLHARKFGMHNFLTGETTDTYENVYFIDKKQYVRKASLSVMENKLLISKLWKFPNSEEEEKNDSTIYNPTLKFITDNLAIASDGKKTFFVLKTGYRGAGNKWKVLHSEELLQGKGFYIQDAVMKDAELHVLLCTIEKGSRPRTNLAVHWITLINESNAWRQKSLRELCVEGDSSYLYLERNCDAIYVASTSSCKFVFDSENIIMDDIGGTQKESHSKLDFKWSQDTNFVAIHFIMANDIKRDHVDVACTSSYIKVKYKNSSLLDGALYAIVDADLKTVSISKNLLEITLAKSDEGDEWTSLLRDVDTRDQYVGGHMENSDNSTGDTDDTEIPETEFNREGVEECDFLNSEHTILERLCATSHKVTHRCSLGMSPVLVTMSADNIKLPSFGIRYDVDICIWEPRFEYNDFKMTHTTTLLALGYIQATTNNKKFICTPSNFEYTVICDTNKHIILYRQNKNVESGELVNNRTGSTPEKAEQRVFTPPPGDILGIFTAPLGIYVLGENHLMYIEA